MIRESVPPKIAALRERLKAQGGSRDREATKSRFAWIGSSVAWLALLVSFGNAYYSIFYYVDEIKLSIDRLPELYFNKELNTFMVNGPRSLAFINSGTREILISKVELDFNQPGKDESNRVPCQVGGIWRSLDMQFSPIVVKPGQIINFAVTYKPGGSSAYVPRVNFEELKEKYHWVDDLIDVQGQNASSDSSKMEIDSCFRFVIVTPDGAMDQVRVRVANHLIEKSAPPTNSATAQWMFNPDIPISLFRASALGSR